MTVAPARVDAAVEAADASDLYERYHNRIFAFCLSRLGDRADAEDATQTAFVYAIKGLQRGVQPEFELAWLLKIAENVCHSMHRRAYRRYERDELTDELGRPDADVAATAERVAELCSAVSELPENQRRAIVLREWRGLSYDDIAEELEVSHSAVETMLFRARKTLVARLRDVGALWFPFPAASRFGRWISGLGGAKGAAAAVVIVGTAATTTTGVVRGTENDASATTRSSPAAVVVRHDVHRADPVRASATRRPARPPADATPVAAVVDTSAAPAAAAGAEPTPDRSPGSPEAAPPSTSAGAASSPGPAPTAPVRDRPESVTEVVEVAEVVESVPAVVDEAVEDVQSAVPVETPALPAVAPVLEAAIAPVTPVLESVPAPALPRLP